MRKALLFGLTALVVGCGGTVGDAEVVELDQPFTSDVATLLDFEFDGELTSGSGANLEGQVRGQLCTPSAI